MLRLGEREHVLLLTMHHIISDGWSMGVLVREWSRLYEALTPREQQSPLAELEIQYADYAQWQREWLQGEVLAATVGVLASSSCRGAPAVLELPTDHPRPAVQSSRGSEAIVVQPELS